MNDLRSNEKYVYLLNIVKAAYGNNAAIGIETNSRFWRDQLTPYVCYVTTTSYEVCNGNTLVGANSLEKKCYQS